jgi:hypothetical protein
MKNISYAVYYIISTFLPPMLELWKLPNGSSTQKIEHFVI